MQSDDFHILVQHDQVRLSWREDQGTPYPLATGLEKDRLIARILQKVLNMHLTADAVEVFGIAEFQVLGTTLFNLLLNADTLRIKFKTFYKEAIASPEQRHRLVLEFDESAGDLSLLPWEYLFYEEDEATQAFLGAHLRKCIDLVRKLPLSCHWLEFDKAKQRIEPPLRVLVIVTNDVRKDVASIVEPTTTYFNRLKQQYDNLIEYRFIIDPNAGNFAERLQNVIADNEETPFHPHIIHFIGRSRMDGEMSQICFPQQMNNGEFIENWVNEDTFANYFEELKYPPYLFFLHIPDGVPTNDYARERGIVLKLMKKSIPFVIAFQNPVPDWMVQHFTEILYDNLLQGQDVANALTEGRIQLARRSKDSRGLKYDDYAHKVFGSPVFYTTVHRPFALAVTPKLTEKIKTSEQFKICTNHPNKRFSLSENWCTLCGKRLVLPSQLSTSSQATAKESSSETTAGRVVEKTPTTVAGAGRQQPDSNANNANQPGYSAQPTVTTAEAASPDIHEQLTLLQRKGMEERLLLLIKKLNHLEQEKIKITDANQGFQIEHEIEILKTQIHTLKKELGLD